MSVDLPAVGDIDGLELALAEPSDRDLRRRLDDASATPVSMTYRLAPEWAAGLQDAIDDLTTHVADAPVASLLLAERTLARLQDADIDDSDGWLIDIGDRLMAVHRDAAQLAGIDGGRAQRRLDVLLGDAR